MGTNFIGLRHLRAALLGCAAALACTAAQAQSAQPESSAAAVSLETIDVNPTSTRLSTAAPSRPARQREPQRRTPPPAAGPSEPATPGAAVLEVPSGIVTNTTITGSSTTVITSDDIERSPSVTVQEILAREPGVQITSLYGGVNGAGTTVDMRGFGATASNNTLILINGRRINDLDLAGVDLSSIPRESIDHIEITRGNSGAVLYGDGAVGGVINIVLKNGASLPPSGRVTAGMGSFKYGEGGVAMNTSSGPWAMSAYANVIGSAGYRQNNVLRQQVGVSDFRYTGDTGGGYLTLSADDQSLGLPGGRLVTPTFSLLDMYPTVAATPFDYGKKKGVNATAGIMRTLAPGNELIVDGGIREKHQIGAFFSDFSPDFDSYVNTHLTTLSLTPRFSSNHNLGSAKGKLLTGIDVYDAIYGSGRSQGARFSPYHFYDLSQISVAAYAMETVNLTPNTDIGFGGRYQWISVSARDLYNPFAPGGLFSTPQGLPFDGEQTQKAWHVGLEHRFNQYFALFARTAQSFRVPNVDERVGQGPFGVATNFDLKTQTSRDYEAGLRLTVGSFALQTSTYLMNLQNEIFFSPATFTNTNLDPTRRYGVETIIGWQATETLRFKGGGAYTRAQFVEGPFSGNDIPLVSRWTANLGVSWNIVQKELVFDAVARYFGPRRMDNDSANMQLLIPGQTLVDLRLGGEKQNIFWALSLQNVFDVRYYEYAISAIDFFTGLPSFGTYSAYPLPGRTYLAKAGVKW
jgi:iron complex outermembrane receptor protein